MAKRGQNVDFREPKFFCEAVGGVADARARACAFL